MLQLLATKRSAPTRAAIGLFAVLVLTITGFSHLHVRYCLDGSEAAVSIHVESSDSHAIEHLGDQELSDIERELSFDTLLSKSLDGHGIYLPPDAYTFDLSVFKESINLPVDDTANYSKSAFLHPPLRAPPALA